MKFKRGIAALVALTLMMLGGTALAMPIRYEAGVLTLAAVGEDGEAAELSLKEFQLMGTDAAGDYLIYADGAVYTVPASQLSALVSLMDAETASGLRGVGGMADLGRGAKGDDVKALQEALKALGYLSGTADGDLGKGSEAAIMAFQAANGFEETGVADAKQQLLAISMAQPEQAITEAIDPKAVFAPIADRANVNMEPIYESGLRFDYDDMTGEGFITDGSVLTFDASGAADIDRYQLTARFGLRVKDLEDGTVDIAPAVEISCLCVRRPVLTEIIVKSGTQRGTAAIENLSATLEGVNSLETGVAVLTEQMTAALANAAENGELKLRVGGKYNSFDVEADSASLAGLAKIGQVAQQIAN